MNRRRVKSKSRSVVRYMCMLWMANALVMMMAGCDTPPEESPSAIELHSASDKVPSSIENDEPSILQLVSPVSAENGEQLAAAGRIVGTVKFNGQVPELPPLIKKGDDNAKDPAICAAADIPDQSLLVNEAAGNGLANVFVYMLKAPKTLRVPVPDEPLIMDQKGCVFMPQAMLVRTGQRVLVLSDDDTAHNVHTFPIRNQPINSLMAPNERVGLELIYSRSEPSPIAVKCDVHSWMTAYHLVLDHPFTALTDHEGKFEIPGMPAGTHKLRVWHERAGILDRDIEIVIKQDETSEMTLEYPASRF